MIRASLQARDKETLRAVTLMLLALAALAGGCSSSVEDGFPLTCRAEQRELRVTLEARGVLRARRSHVLSSRGMWGRRLPEIAYLAEEGAWVEKDEPVVEFASTQIVDEYESAQRELANATADMRSKEAAHEQRVSQITSQIESAEASAASAELQLARLEFVAPRERQRRELEIERSRLQAGRSRSELVSAREVYREEKAQQQLRIKQAEAKVQSALAAMDELVLRAPVAGYVVIEENRVTDEKFQQGDTPYPGMPIARIPDMSAMEVEVELSETEVKNLETGQKATITVSSVSSLRLPGSVTQVARIAKPVRRGSDVKTVQAVVALDSLVPGLVPGITAYCEIELRRDSAAVVVPLDAVFEQDSLRLVYLRDGRGFLEREVRLGWRGMDFASVDTGLSGGEELALAEPQHSLVSGTELLPREPTGEDGNGQTSTVTDKEE